MTQVNKIDHGYKLLGQKRFNKAIDDFQSCINNDKNDVDAFIGLARSYLGTGQLELAKNLYHTVLELGQSKRHQIAQMEALIFLGQVNHPLLKVNGEELTSEHYFLLSLSRYLTGHVVESKYYMKKVTRSEDFWEIEDPIDPLLHYLLNDLEYQDLENIYLDAEEAGLDSGQSPQNRWISISMPSYEIFGAKSHAEQLNKCKDFKQILSINQSEMHAHSGKELLLQIINGLNGTEIIVEFINPALELLKQDDFSHLSELVLGLLLSHLNQFANVFALTPEFIQNSNLQDLIALLPYRLAVGIAFLYTAAYPMGEMNILSPVQLHKDELATLIAHCFIGFYQEIHHYKRLNSKEV